MTENNQLVVHEAGDVGRFHETALFPVHTYKDAAKIYAGELPLFPNDLPHPASLTYISEHSLHTPPRPGIHIARFPQESSIYKLLSRHHLQSEIRVASSQSLHVLEAIDSNTGNIYAAYTDTQKPTILHWRYLHGGYVCTKVTYDEKPERPLLTLQHVLGEDTFQSSSVQTNMHVPLPELRIDIYSNLPSEKLDIHAGQEEAYRVIRDAYSEIVGPVESIQTWAEAEDLAIQTSMVFFPYEETPEHLRRFLDDPEGIILTAFTDAQQLYTRLYPHGARRPHIPSGVINTEGSARLISLPYTSTSHDRSSASAMINALNQLPVSKRKMLSHVDHILEADDGDDILAATIFFNEVAELRWICRERIHGVLRPVADIMIFPLEEQGPTDEDKTRIFRRVRPDATHITDDMIHWYIGDRSSVNAPITDIIRGIGTDVKGKAVRVRGNIDRFGIERPTLQTLAVEAARRLTAALQAAEDSPDQ